MAYRVTISENAFADFLEIVSYITLDSQIRAFTFVDELKIRIDNLLSVFPNSGKRIGNRRMMSLENYIIVYRVDEKFKIVHVLMVTEGHRDWQEILGERT